MLSLILPNLLYLFLPSYSHYLYRPQNLTNTVNNVVLYSYFFSLIHSAYISTMSILFLYDRLDCQLYTYLSLYSIFYLGVDIFILNYESQFSKMKKIFTIHHSLFIILIYLNYIDYMKYDYLDTYLIAVSLLGEICVLPLNLNWYLIKTKRKKTLLFKISNYLLIVTYLLFRIIGYTSIFFIIIKHHYYIIFLISLPIIIMNYVWFYKIFKLE